MNNLINKLNIKHLIKRTLSYLIDIFIIILISIPISNIKLLNKNSIEYNKIQKEYTNTITEYNDLITKIDEYNSKKVTEEAYEEFIKIENYRSLFESYHEDNSLDNKELKHLKEEITNKYRSISLDYQYKLSKLSIPNTICTLICTLIYFTIVPIILKGKTIGKLIFKLRLVSINDKKINIFSYLLRSIILNNIILNAINLTLLGISSRKIYDTYSNIINILISLVETLIVLFILFREDNRGLHDILSNTKVIEDAKNVIETDPTSE